MGSKKNIENINSDESCYDCFDSSLVSILC